MDKLLLRWNSQSLDVKYIIMWTKNFIVTTYDGEDLHIHVILGVGATELQQALETLI